MSRLVNLSDDLVHLSGARPLFAQLLPLSGDSLGSLSGLFLRRALNSFPIWQSETTKPEGRAGEFAKASHDASLNTNHNVVKVIEVGMV
jgi:hypothetical protein